MKLWLDDIRDPNRFGRIGWHWVQSAEACIELLKSGTVDEISLDHDLTVDQTMGIADGEKTGYTVVCFMEEHEIWPENGTHVHSQNPVGREKMQRVINRAYERLAG